MPPRQCLLLGPLAGTAQDVTFRFAVDASVDVPRPSILTYPDGWAHVLGGDTTMVRFDPSERRARKRAAGAGRRAPQPSRCRGILAP